MALPIRKRERPSPTPRTSPFADRALPLVPSLYNLAMWLTGSATEAEDLVQEAVVKARRGFASFEPGTSFKVWIFRILRTAWLTSRTGLAAKEAFVLDAELDSAEHTAEIERRTPDLGSGPLKTGQLKALQLSLLALTDRDALHTGLESLTPPLLEAILLCDVEEMRYREIAAVLDVPERTVISRIVRARAALRAELRRPASATMETIR